MKDLYKFGITGHDDIVERFKDEPFNIIPKWSLRLPEEMVYLGEQLILSVVKKDFYLQEQLNGITEMRVFDEKHANHIISSLYDFKNDFLNKYPQYNKYDKTWKKLYFVKVLYNE
tara:strand:+ start:339 stop:683 length:345 start_codon:yes stop_codon:yes gene_type:complete